MAGCNSPLVAHTLTKPFFEILSGFGHPVGIDIGRKEFRDWISTLPSEFRFVSYCSDLGMQLDLQLNASRNLMAIIFAFVDLQNGPYGSLQEFKYAVKNMTSGFRWSDTLFHCYDYESLIAIVPSSILSIKDGDDRIEITADRGILCGIHLLYKTEITMIRCPSLGDLESEMNSLSLGGNTNNVEDERSNHSANVVKSELVVEIKFLC